MVTETSKLTYKTITKDGTKSRQSDDIYNLIIRQISHVSNFNDYDNGISLREISKHCDFDLSAISARVNELKRQGKLEEVPKRKCFVTQRTITPVRYVRNKIGKVKHLAEDKHHSIHRMQTDDEFKEEMNKSHKEVVSR